MYPIVTNPWRILTVIRLHSVYNTLVPVLTTPY